jgi:hypothetical protein
MCVVATIPYGVWEFSAMAERPVCVWRVKLGAFQYFDRARSH